MRVSTYSPVALNLLLSGGSCLRNVNLLWAEAFLPAARPEVIAERISVIRSSMKPSFLFAGCLVLSGCYSHYNKKAPFYPEMPSSGEKKADGWLLGDNETYTKKALLSPAERVLSKALEAENKPRGDMTSFVDAGITFSDIIFDRVFDSFKTHQDRVRYDQNLLNIVGSGAVGILGLTGAESKALGILGITQATLNSDFQNYAGIYLLTPALGQLHDKVADARRSAAEKLLVRATSMSFDEARRNLNSYHQLGSLMSLQEYLRKSVDVAKFTLIDPDEIARSSATPIVSFRLQQALNLSTSLDETGILAIYLIIHDLANADKLSDWYDPGTPSVPSVNKTDSGSSNDVNQAVPQLGEANKVGSDQAASVSGRAKNNESRATQQSDGAQNSSVQPEVVRQMHAQKTKAMELVQAKGLANLAYWIKLLKAADVEKRYAASLEAVSALGEAESKLQLNRQRIDFDADVLAIETESKTSKKVENVGVKDFSQKENMRIHVVPMN